MSIMEGPYSITIFGEDIDVFHEWYRNRAAQEVAKKSEKWSPAFEDIGMLAAALNAQDLTIDRLGGTISGLFDRAAFVTRASGQSPSQSPEEADPIASEAVRAVWQFTRRIEAQRVRLTDLIDRLDS